MTRPLLLDLTELFFQIGRGPMTGITRVTLTYLHHCLTLERPVFGLINHRRGVMLLGRDDMAWFARSLSDRYEWAGDRAAPGLRERLRTDLLPAQRAALSALRARALARALPLGLRLMLRRRLPPGTVALLTGLSNLDRATFAAFNGAGLAPVVMIHDTIPLDFPHYVPKGGDAWFARRLQAVGAQARQVLYISDQTRRDAEGHLARLGHRVPPGVVAHLGVTPMQPDLGAVPADLDLTQPFFVILGTIEPRKNHAFLLDLWEEMARGGLASLPRLLILGSRGWRNEEFFARLEGSPLYGQVVIERANLPDGAVAAIVAQARALLFPSHAEGFGLPAIEAAHLGTPVLANDLPVYREFLGDYPYLVPVANTEAWMQALGALAWGGLAARTPPALPRWEGHFATVMATIDQLP